MTSLTLSPIERSDLALIQSWRNSKKVLPYVREYRLLSLEHVEKWFEDMILDDKFQMFMMHHQSIPIGICGLTYINWQNRHADLHFAIYKDDKWIDDRYAPEFYKIIADYAFGDLNLNKMYVEVYENDHKKISFFESQHFKLDGRNRQHYYHKGEYLDSLIYSILKVEYLGENL